MNIIRTDDYELFGMLSTDRLLLIDRQVQWQILLHLGDVLVFHSEVLAARVGGVRNVAPHVLQPVSQLHRIQQVSEDRVLRLENKIREDLRFP